MNYYQDRNYYFYKIYFVVKEIDERNIIIIPLLLELLTAEYPNRDLPKNKNNNIIE